MARDEDVSDHSSLPNEVGCVRVSGMSKVWQYMVICWALVCGCGVVAEEEKAPVAQALTQAKILHCDVNLNADYYIYIQSAGWCAPCKREMAELVKIYPEMKAQNVELIVVCQDGTEEEAAAYLKSFSSPFPGVHFKAADALPGFTLSRTVPHATVVNKQGEVIAKGHGSLARKWLQIITADQED